MSVLRTAVRRVAIVAGDCGCALARRAAAVRAPTCFSRGTLASSSRSPILAAARAITTTAPRPRVQRDPWAANPTIDFEDVKELAEQPTDDVILIDVRDPDEVELGTIPSAVNLPLPRIEEALSPRFNPGQFKREFAFPKPLPEQKIVFFCRSGRRSGIACEIAEHFGYPNTRNYVGSMLEWVVEE